jgi:radical SAM protein with 4Fe4S-binding SPASM domain
MQHKIIYIKTTENCNLYCEHCFVPRVEKKMDLETIKKIINFINETFNKEKTSIHLIWHGGEPTLIGIKWMKEALELFKNNINDNIEIINEIQTNLMNYNDEWKELYKEYFNNYIGISYDFGIRYFKNSNEEFEKIFWNNFNKLIEDKIDYNMIITVTKNVIDMKPENFWNWIRGKNISSLHLERLTKTGYAVNNWDKIGFNNKQYNDFMLEFSKIYVKHIIDNDKKGEEYKNYLKISPLNSLLINTIEDKRSSCAGACHNFYTFNPDGSVKGCTSLENKIGHIDDDFKQIVAKNIISKRHCLDCEFQKVCNSGCPTMPIFDESEDCIGNYRLLKFFKYIGNQYNFKNNLSNKEIFNQW